MERPQASLWPNDLYTRQRTATIAAPRKGPHPARIQLPLTKHRLLINNWIRDSPITGVRTDLQSHAQIRRISHVNRNQRA